MLRIPDENALKVSDEPKFALNHASVTTGIPASRVPAGQSVQKNGSLISGGRMITKRIRTTYLPYSKKWGIRTL